MARPSKLTPAQWEEIAKRRIDGVSRRSLALEFGISEASIREREEKLGRSPTVQAVASMIVETEAALKSLPVSAQVSAHNLADKLRSISNSYASAAELGAKTAHRLHALANAEVCKVDDSNPLSEDSLTAMKGVSLLTKLGNDALVPASNLLAANKDTVTRLNTTDDEASSEPLRPQVSRSEWEKRHAPAN
jgi:hypothetical protein